MKGPLLPVTTNDRDGRLEGTGSTFRDKTSLREDLQNRVYLKETAYKRAKEREKVVSRIESQINI